MMGLGYRQPYQVSVEALRWLRDCDIVYSNLSDAAVTELLGLFAKPVRPIVFRRRDRQAVLCARDIAAGLLAARRVAVVTRGMPVFYGWLAYRLAALARRRGIRFRLPGSVSIVDTIAALAGGCGALGVQARDLGALERLDARVPTVVYNAKALDARLGARLCARYGADHPAWLLPGSGDEEFTVKPHAVGALAAALRRADPAVTLLLPPRERYRLAATASARASRAAAPSAARPAQARAASPAAAPPPR